MGNFLIDLVKLYEANGYEVQSSLSPLHFPGFDLADIPFSYIYHNGEKMCRGGGLAISELMFLDGLTSINKPNNIFVIGNAFGWTTLALGLMCPTATVVAIDMCPRPDEELGIKVTNDLGKQIPSTVRAVKAKSPDNVAEVISTNFTGGIDLAVIDGGHTSAQQSADFRACNNFANNGCVYIFHDVLNFQMVDSFTRISLENENLISSLLFRTPSGMGISYPKPLNSRLSELINAFTESDSRVRALHQEGKRKINKT